MLICSDFSLSLFIYQALALDPLAQDSEGAVERCQGWMGPMMGKKQGPGLGAVSSQLELAGEVLDIPEVLGQQMGDEMGVQGHVGTAH